MIINNHTATAPPPSVTSALACNFFTGIRNVLCVPFPFRPVTCCLRCDIFFQFYPAYFTAGRGTLSGSFFVAEAAGVEPALILLPLPPLIPRPRLAGVKWKNHSKTDFPKRGDPMMKGRPLYTLLRVSRRFFIPPATPALLPGRMAVFQSHELLR